jgi:hypothetical protein
LLSSPPKANLEGWWKLDQPSGQPRYDSGIYAQDLNESPNAVAQSTSVFRVSGSSAGQFSTDGLTLADSSLHATFPGKNGGITTAFTAGCFVHPVAGSGSDYIMCKDGSFLLYYAHTGTKISAQFGAEAAIAADAVTATAKWWCAAVRWDGSEFSLWIAGVKQAAVTAAATMVHNTNPFMVGAQNASGTNFLAGYVNDAFVFSRALSDSEMKKISMVGATSFFGPSNGLLGYWPMDEAAGSTRYDFSPGMAHLLESGSVPQQTALFKRGTASAGKFSTTPSVLKCLDSTLPSGFPWKNGAAAIEWTIGMWIYQTATANTCAYKKGAAIELQWGFPGANLYGLLFNNALLLVSPSVATGEWRQIVVRWRGEDDDLVEFIVDGAKQGGGGAQTANAGNASDFLVGAQTTLNGLPTNGYIDEAFVFARALADQEILEIYNDGLESFLVPSFSVGSFDGAPAKGRKIPKARPGYPARGQRTGGSGGGGRRKGSGAIW